MAIAKKKMAVNLNITSIDPMTINEGLREIAAIIELLKKRMQDVLNIETIQIIADNGYEDFEIVADSEGIKIIPNNELL